MRPNHRTSSAAGIAAIATVALLGVSGCGIFRGHEAPSAYVDDSALTARVKTELVKDPEVKASEIDVNTYQGRVTLNGVVDNATMAKRAVSIARGTPGVKSVHSALQVASAAPRDESHR
jgi:osmotically-inducible protein OsmY